MNSNSILQSNLLDIIFENRNKDYGAYVLRRDYNKRLLSGLLAMMGIVAMFAALQFFKSNEPEKIFSSFSPRIDTLTLSDAPKPDLPKPKQNIQPPVRAPKVPSEIPVIVKDPDVVKKPPLNSDILKSDPGTIDGPPSDVPPATPIPGGNGDKLKEIPKPNPPVVLHEPTASPDVMPQYPGGMNEFIKFMRKNLHSPRDLEEDENISVRIKFVVNYDGTLKDFSILETGSKIFDDEVVRVLKKMPKWIPGKTHGNDVSVLYTLPVKFTPQQ